MYAQFRDATGKWSSSTTDTIVLDRGGSSGSSAYRLQPPPHTTGGGLFPGSRDTFAPVIVQFSLTRRRFAIARPQRRGRRGTTFRYIVSEVQFELPSRRDVKKCVVTKETIEKNRKPTLVTEAAPEEPAKKAAESA